MSEERWRRNGGVAWIVYFKRAIFKRWTSTQVEMGGDERRHSSDRTWLARRTAGRSGQSGAMMEFVGGGAALRSRFRRLRCSVADIYRVEQGDANKMKDEDE
jgi:hypothetical protein